MAAKTVDAGPLKVGSQTIATAGVPAVAMRGIEKRFPGVVALDGVDLTVQPGEIHAVAGENGSGKSTLVKVLYGALAPDEGTVAIEGAPVSFRSPHDAVASGIAAISQELTLATDLTVTENILMGRLPRRRRSIDWGSARELARDALDALEVAVDERACVRDLSVEEQQSVEIARALSRRPRILVLDEATSSLTEHATNALFKRLDNLREQGVAIIFISHRLRELFESADRVTVLRDGRLVAETEMSALSEPELVRMMVGREIGNLYGKRAIAPGRPQLSVSSLSTEDGVVRDVALTVRAGEIVGVAGLVGCGKREFGRALAGATAATGSLEVAGVSVPLSNPIAALEAGIVLIPDDRKGEAVLSVRSVRENFSVGWLRTRHRFGLVNRSRERAFVNDGLRRFAVRAASPEAPMFELSGGNQQKVILGRWFSTDPSVAILAEPTRGIDVGAKAEVYALIQDLAEGGSAILMISSEMTELLGLADRILVMYQGEIRTEILRDNATEENITHAAMGGTQ